MNKALRIGNLIVKESLINKALKKLKSLRRTSKKTTLEYFIWLQELLSKMDPAWAVIEIGDSHSDELQLLPVYEQDVEEISALCQSLNVHCKKTTVA